MKGVLIIVVFTGVPLYVIPDDIIYDPQLLAEYLQEHQITRMLFTPSLLEALLKAEGELLTKKLKKMK